MTSGAARETPPDQPLERLGESRCAWLRTVCNPWAARCDSRWCALAAWTVMSQHVTFNPVCLGRPPRRHNVPVRRGRPVRAQMRVSGPSCSTMGSAIRTSPSLMRTLLAAAEVRGLRAVWAGAGSLGKRPGPEPTIVGSRPWRGQRTLEQAGRACSRYFCLGSPLHL